MKKKHPFFLFVLPLLLMACSSDEPNLDGSNLREDSLSDTQRAAVKLVRDFRRQNRQAAEKNNLKMLPSLGDISIDGIERQHYTVNLNTSKSANTPSPTDESDRTNAVPDTAQFDLYTVTFHADTLNGFAIVSPDPRLNRVYAYAESGAVTDTVYNLPMRWAIRAIPDIAREDIETGYSKATSRLKLLPSDYDVYCMVSTAAQWHQGYPFNMFAPACTCGGHGTYTMYNNHMPIGCATVAVGQLIAKCRRFNATYYGAANLNYGALAASGIPSTANYNSVGAFMHEVAVMIQMKFGCTDGGSGTVIEASYNYLKDLGYSCYLTTGAINDADLIRDLSNDIPHITRGQNSDGGHQWLVMGYRKLGNDAMYYCNWGWGPNSGNGWYADYRNSPLGFFNVNNKHIYVTSANL